MKRFDLRAIASLRLTIVLLGWIAAGALAVSQELLTPTFSLALPLALLDVNLVAAIVFNPAFRRQLPLLVFHLALASIVALAAVGRLTYLRATAEVTEGQEFQGLTRIQSGPLHHGAIDQVRFINERVTVNYAPGPRRTATSSQVRWFDASNQEHEFEISDGKPLVLEGYRFGTTVNKGFAPILLWRGPGAAPVRGTVQLPPYPAHEGAQWSEWNLPGAVAPVFLGLDIRETVLPEDRPSILKAPRQHVLIVRLGEERHEVRPGATISIAGGLLTYEELRLWMGYEVSYDWTLPWMLAAGIVAVMALTRHFQVKFSRHGWNAPLDVTREVQPDEH